MRRQFFCFQMFAWRIQGIFIDWDMGSGRALADAFHNVSNELTSEQPIFWQGCFGFVMHAHSDISYALVAIEEMNRSEKGF